MKHNNWKPARLIVAIVTIAFGSSASAQLLEWQLSGMQPTDIDTDAINGDAYFLDPATSTVNRLTRGGILTQWFMGPCVVTPFDKIAVSDALMYPGVYSTSITTNRICLLDPSTNILKWWDMPFVVSNPETLSIDGGGNAWFSSSAPLPAVGYLDPTMNQTQMWLLPAAVAAAGDRLAGSQFANNRMYFSVTGAQNQICILDPAFAPSPTDCYSMPYNFPAPIRVNGLGHVYRIAAPSVMEIARLRPFPANLLTRWTTPNAPDIYLSPVDPPYFTSTFPAVDRLDPLAAGMDNAIAPVTYRIYGDRITTAVNMINAPWATSAPPVINSALVLTVAGAFNVWATISSSGPIAIDPFGQVWISETAPGRIATFQP